MKNTAVEDLINFQYHGSIRQNKMSGSDRAAQFSPFAALTAYKGVLTESVRKTEQRLDVDEDRCDKINTCLSAVLENFPEKTAARIVYFVPDKRKAGGAYETVTGEIRWIDESDMTVIFSDNSTVPINDIYDMELI